MITAVNPTIYEKLEHKPEPGDVLARIDAIRPRDLDQVGFLLEKFRRANPSSSSSSVARTTFPYAWI